MYIQRFQKHLLMFCLIAGVSKYVICKWKIRSCISMRRKRFETPLWLLHPPIVRVSSDHVYIACTALRLNLYLLTQTE